MKKTLRWVVLGGVALIAGATAGFAISLLRPRHYATFSGVRSQPNGR